MEEEHGWDAQNSHEQELAAHVLEELEIED